jgi:hypothetical protein
VRDAQLVYNAWFALLERRLGFKKMVHSLYDVERFLADNIKDKWRYYIAELELRAFQSREMLFDIGDLIKKTYEWLDELESIL